MVTAVALTIGELTARLAVVVAERRLQEAAIDRLTGLYTTSFGQWGQSLDQMRAAPFGSPQYIAHYREFSKALHDACELDLQRQEEQARLDKLRSREETARRQLSQARAQDELDQCKLKYASESGEGGG